MQPTPRPPDPTRGIRRVLESDPDLLHRAEVEIQKATTPELGDVLHRIESAITSYVVLPKWAPLPISLWVMGTYPPLLDCFDAVAYLTFTSPTPGCGKTRTLELIEFLCWNPLRTGNISESALFRAISKFSPTLLFDEAEIISGKGERADMLRGILNAGNRRDSFTYRCAGPSHEIDRFSVFGPKVFAAIGHVPRTLADRSICVPMQRKREAERVGRLTKRNFGPVAEGIRNDVTAAAGQFAEDVRNVYSRIELDFLPDRDEEAWTPLFAICSVAAPERLEYLRECALTATGTKLTHAEEENIRLELLADIRKVWAEDQRKIFSTDLLGLLRAQEGGAWTEDCPLTTRKLSGFLRPFGVERCQVRVAGATRKGYDRRDAEEAFSRYLRPENEPQ